MEVPSPTLALSHCLLRDKLKCAMESWPPAALLLSLLKKLLITELEGYCFSHTKFNSQSSGVHLPRAMELAAVGGELTIFQTGYFDFASSNSWAHSWHFPLLLTLNAAALMRRALSHSFAVMAPGEKPTVFSGDCEWKSNAGFMRL